MWTGLEVDKRSDFVEVMYYRAAINFVCLIFTHYLTPAHLMAHSSSFPLKAGACRHPHWSDLGFI